MKENHAILIFGINGQVGSALLKQLHKYQVKGIDIPDVDFTDPNSIEILISKLKPKLIINAAAYTVVDKAESQIDLANQVNGYCVGFIAQIARKLKAGFIHYSTDYVYDGSKKELYIESDRTNPLSAYGKSKLLGDQLALESGGGTIILRTSWVYSLQRDSFVSKVLKWARTNETLKIVDDQISNPSWAAMVAEKTVELIDQAYEQWFEYFSNHSGIYHLAGKGAVSRFTWAKKILELDPHKDEQKVKTLLPAKTADFPTPAVRPLYSGLDCNKFESTFGIIIPDWGESLELAMQGASNKG